MHVNSEVSYKGNKLKGYTKDPEGNVYGISGKLLSVKNNKVVVTIKSDDGTSSRVSVHTSELVPVVQPEVETVNAERIVHVDIAEDKYDAEADIFTRMDMVAGMMSVVGIHQEDIMNGVNRTNMYKLATGNLTRSEMDVLYYENVYLFALREVNVLDGTKLVPFNFNEVSLVTLHAMTNSISLLLTSPRCSRNTTASLVGLIHSLLYNGTNIEHLVGSPSIEDSRRNIAKVASMIMNMNNIPTSDFVISANSITCNRTGNRITAFMTDAEDGEALLSRAQGMTQPIQFFDSFEFIPSVETILGENSNVNSNNNYSSTFGHSTINRNLSKSTLEFLNTIPEITDLSQIQNKSSYYRMTLKKEDITGYKEPVGFDNYGEDVIMSEINLVRESNTALSISEIIELSKFNWYTDVADSVERALNIINTADIRYLPQAIVDDITDDGVVDIEEASDEVTGVYTIRYVNQIISNGIDYSLAFKYDNEDDILFAVFGTNDKTFINGTINGSDALKTSYLNFLKSSVTYVHNKSEVVVSAMDILDCLDCSADGLVSLSKALRSHI